MSVVDITILILKLIVAALHRLMLFWKYLSNSGFAAPKGSGQIAPFTLSAGLRFGYVTFYDTLNDA
ncbi:hypothetical protein KCP76_09320 [Salmonella enterica subsp. enterica serovar Weltevreden]|nr:hypothetical protein KCP76_09320 [Salmonella enterica subsp. enterica serovar Weltevreden]